MYKNRNQYDSNHVQGQFDEFKVERIKRERKRKTHIYIMLSCGFKPLLEQSCDEIHFFLSSGFNWFVFLLRIERPQPAVIVPSREKARLTIGDEGTLFGLIESESGTVR